jgi:hypothetical protein
MPRDSIPLARMTTWCLTPNYFNVTCYLETCYGLVLRSSRRLLAKINRFEAEMPRRCAGGLEEKCFGGQYRTA